MKNEPRFGAATPKDQWVQRTTNQSPRGLWVEQAPPPMPLWGRVAWVLYVVAIVTVIITAARM